MRPRGWAYSFYLQMSWRYLARGVYKDLPRPVDLAKSSHFRRELSVFQRMGKAGFPAEMIDLPAHALTADCATCALR
ncbi:unnamed protein product [Heligmosomoides polygyrus]|uniref:DUF2236 domain-containing protein n=1 Tax=Heligmosomoides polygyrus TaxID=6339 RepID=A0A183FN76_HELPZ|nr:unnamed protein product [Heligmosomoides polygyrus]